MANRVFATEHTDHTKYHLPTAKEKTIHKDVTRWSIPKSDCIHCSQRWGSSIESATRLEADYGSDNEILIAKFRLKLKKVGKITRPLSSVQFSHSVTQSCLTLCDRMNCSSTGFHVHHHLLELTQTHVHGVSDAI